MKRKKKEQIALSLKPVEDLDFNVDKFQYEVQQQLKIYGFEQKISSKKIAEAFNATVAVEWIELDESELTRDLFVKKDGTGKYYSIKNVGISLFDFVEALFELVNMERKYWIVFGAILGWKVLRELRVDLDETLVAIAMILYQKTRKYIVTDDNLEEIVERGLQEYDYGEIPTEEIIKIVGELMELGIVEIEEGRYFVTQTIYFS